MGMPILTCWKLDRQKALLKTTITDVIDIRLQVILLMNI
jgi:hypothetical protein